MITRVEQEIGDDDFTKLFVFPSSVAANSKKEMASTWRTSTPIGFTSSLGLSEPEDKSRVCRNPSDWIPISNRSSSDDGRK